jgi:DNA-directed RNA polymerase specialized sigma24 family protein
LKPGERWSEHERALRRFGAALVRDDRTVRDDRAAAELVEPLIRQTLLAFCNHDGSSDGADDQRARLFAQFIQRYRRHMRMIAAGDDESDWAAAPLATRQGDLRAAIHHLPLELREAMLLVVVEGFSHARAAATLEVSMTQLLERLATARRILGGALQRGGEVADPARRRSALHLRLIK